MATAISASLRRCSRPASVTTPSATATSMLRGISHSTRTSTSSVTSSRMSAPRCCGSPGPAQPTRAVPRQRRTLGIPSPIHEMISRWISLLPPPKVKMTAER
jgi:hypothetical protein